MASGDYEYSFLPPTTMKSYKVKYMVANSLTTAFLFGFSLTSINPVKNFIAIQFNWCSEDPLDKDLGFTYKCGTSLAYGSIITVGVLVGAVIGSVVGGQIVSFGRRYAIMVSHIIYFLGNILSGMAEGILTLALGRVILGIGIGTCAYATPLYISEITPKKSRGLYGVLFQLFITVGILIANVLGLFIGGAPMTFSELNKFPLTNFQTWWWRFLLGFPAIVSVISLFLTWYFFVLETPHFMMIKQEYSECAALLRVVNEKEDVEEEYNTIFNAVAEAKRIASVSIPIWKALTNPFYRNVVLIGFTLSAFQQFTGINLLITNSNRLFSSLGLDSNTQHILSVGLTGLNVLMTFPPIFIIDKLGRRTLLMISITGMTFGLIPGLISNLVDPNSQATALTSAISTFVFIVFFAIGYGPIPYVFLHEIFPVEIKQSASSFSMACNWAASIAIVAPSDFLLSDSSLLVFCILVATNIIALLFIFFFIKETKGISIDESPYFKNKSMRKITSFKTIHNSPLQSPINAKSSGLRKTNSRIYDEDKLSAEDNRMDAQTNENIDSDKVITTSSST